MKRKLFWFYALIVMFLVTSCSTEKPGLNPTYKEWEIPDIPFPLAEPGPYYTGRMDYTFVDQTRNNRQIHVEIWYPAVETTDKNGKTIRYEAKPDKSGAPYPLILTEHRAGNWIFEDHLATHGFITAVITVPDHGAYTEWDFQMIDWPRDFLASLDQLASQPLKELKGMVDTDHVGVVGYSFGGDIALTLSGVRIDPENYLIFCNHPPEITSIFGGADWYHGIVCKLAGKWDEFFSLVGEKITSSDKGLWQPITDERIVAVMPMAPSGTWLYGEDGLSSANRPLLMIASTEDEFIPYQAETAFLFEHLGSPQKALITFVGQSHMTTVTDEAQVNRLKHFTVAFFGYQLQNRENYKMYYSEEFISQFPDLFWGVYGGN